MATLTSPLFMGLAVALMVHTAATAYVAFEGLLGWLDRRQLIAQSRVTAIMWSYIVVRHRIRHVRYHP
jgi:hypothetical protein